MIYCPHCHRPTARSVGPCPHCGQELSGAKSTPAASSPVVAAAPAAVPSHLPVAAVPPEPERSAGCAASSGLELDFDFGPDLPSPSSASGGRYAGSVPTALIARDAGYRKPGNGPLGAVLYWLRVRKRRRALGDELRGAIAERDRARAKSETAFAALGRGAHALGLMPEAAEGAVDAALAAESSIRDRASRQAERHADFETQIATAAAALQEAEATAAPFREVEHRLLEEKKQLDAKRRGCETNRKRYQIELKNIEALSAQKRGGASGGGAPSDETLAELTALGERREEALSKISDLDAALSASAVPTAENETKLAEASRVLSPYNDRCAEIRAEVAALKQKVADADSADRDAAQNESANVEHSWAEAGRAALRERVRHSELDPKTAEAVASAGRASDADATVASLEACLNAYDRDAIRRAEQTFCAAAALIVLLIAVLIIL